MARLRFKLDENLPRDAGTLLEQAGHDVDTVPNQNLAGHPDAEVLQACQQERRPRVTLDLGFADLRLYSATERAQLRLALVLHRPRREVHLAFFEVIGTIRNIDTIAMGGRIRDLARLERVYGPGQWRKLKGDAKVRLQDGTVREAELHWYEATGIGRKEFKIKRYLG